MATRFADENTQAIVVSNDRDMWQLVNKNVLIMVPTTTGKAEWIGSDEVKKRMGIAPNQVSDYKGLKGDPSDNIPGVHGIGEKTALKLIQDFGSVEDIYKNIQKVEPKSVQEKLLNNAEEAVMSKHLATIITDVPVTVNLEDCRYHDFNKVKVKEVMERYHFRSLIKRLGFEVDGPKKEEPPENQLGLF
jgi:DNA polymerase-1